MSKLRILAGSATSTELLAILISVDDARVPDVQVEEATMVEVAPSELPPEETWGGASKLLDELANRQVRFYRVRVVVPRPGAEYEIVATLDAWKARATMRSLPSRIPDDGIQLALYTCYYDGYKHGDSLLRGLESPVTRRPIDFGFVAGDNVYLDVPPFPKGTGAFDGTAERYIRYFLESPYGFARAAHTTFLTLDDHDFWNNFPGSPLWLTRDRPRERGAYIDAARNAAWLFGAQASPPTVGRRAYEFRVDPVSFFVADLRSDRDLDSRRMMAPEDLELLLAWLAGLDGPGVLVTSQPFWIARGRKVEDRNPPFFEEEYDQILKALFDAPFDVLILSGDVHYSSAMRLGWAQPGEPERNCYEVVSSPACHIPDGEDALSNREPKPGEQPRTSLSEIASPQSLRGFAKRLSYQWYFATSVPNTFGLLRLRPAPGDRRVAVGVTFVDHLQGQVAKAEVLPPELGLPLINGICHTTDLFTLGPR